MDQPSLCDDDIVTWSEQQAASLRALAARPDLSNARAWENIAEEVEGLRRSQTQGVESAILLVLVPKYLSAPSAQSTRSWRVEVVAYQATARRNYKRSMRQRIDWEDLWTTAKANAAVSLEMYGDSPVPGSPATMPFDPDEIVAKSFDMDWALERLASALEMPADHH
ncbi:DUF29 family protein [Methylobacterium sp. WL6]|uniref:DUF29 family protein n=1 Tax=Methylobacterium sp. WL6 TaxID=2603901 RepID=UPI0011CA6B0A|nr:DUF29 family protein [Methylobacterium sp. WL6]TXN66658.1 DUF29 domain-containing protein [Methylobacterium sp. WL6]